MIIGTTLWHYLGVLISTPNILETLHVALHAVFDFLTIVLGMIFGDKYDIIYNINIIIIVDEYCSQNLSLQMRESHLNRYEQRDLNTITLRRQHVTGLTEVSIC